MTARDHNGGGNERTDVSHAAGIVRDHPPRAPAWPATIVATLIIVAGCAPASLLDRAIRARGGPLTAVMLRAEANVHVGFPGRWQYTRAFLLPNRYAWSIETATEPQVHLFDGTTVRSFIGAAEVAEDASPGAPLRSHARWTAVVNLDALHAPGIQLTPLPATALPAGVSEGLSARFPDGQTYRLGFDERTLLVWTEGPLDLWPVAKGIATVRYSDHRATASRLLPFAAAYAIGGRRVAEERVLAACVDPPGLTPASFTDPAHLPDCR